MFIDGITVLNSSPCDMTLPKTIILAIIVGVLIGVVGGLMWAFCDDSFKWWRFVVSAIIGFVAIVCLCGYLSNWWDKDYISYQVTIDDSVSWQDVNELYDVIDVEGDIVTLRIKEK